MNQAEWHASLESGKRGEVVIASALCGRSFWGSDTGELRTYWDKRTVCEAQHWDKVGELQENYDFIVSCPACKDCMYFDTCDSDKPYHVQIEERHEAKTNYSTHMDKNYGTGTGRTQNIYIEIIQNYDAWLIETTEEEKDKRLGWYHEKFKDNRPKWYHFYQPIVDPKGDRRYSSKPDKASITEIDAFIQQAQPGDSLVIENPWGYILSITADALEGLISALETKNKIKPLFWNDNKDILIAKLMPVIDIEPNGRDIVYIPVFTEIGFDGKPIEHYPIKTRHIPKRLKEEVITDTPELHTIGKDGINYRDGQPLIRYKNGEYVIYSESGEPFMTSGTPQLFETKTIRTRREFYKGHRQFGRGGTPWPYYFDLDNMAIFEGGGGKDEPVI